MTSTRNFGRQSSSVATRMARGLRSVTNRASMSRKPRTAFTGWPSGALNAVTGMPKNARNITLDPSINSQSAAMQRIVSQGGLEPPTLAHPALPKGGGKILSGGKRDLLGEICLQLSAERKNCVFVARPSNQLDPDGQPAGTHRQRQADRRLSGAIEGMRETQPVKELCRGALDVLAEGPDFRRRISQRRREQHIDLVPGRDQFPGLLVQPRERLQVFDGRRRCSGLEHQPVERIQQLGPLDGE